RRMPPDLPGAPETRFRRRAPRREPRPRFPRPPAVRTPTPRRARYRTPRPQCVRFGARRRRTPPPDCTARGDRARSPLPESAPAHRRPFWLRASRAGRARCPPPRPRSARRARARGWRGAPGAPCPHLCAARAAPQPRVVVLVLLAQQVGTVEEDAVGDFGPLVDPAGGVAGRLYVAAIHELHPVLAREAGGAARPQ